MSKILAIKGDKERGNDVIALLEMLGGHCDELLSSGNRNEEDYFYFILKEEKNVIDAFPLSKKELFEHDVQIFTLDEFYEKYPYKVGDEVIIKRKNKEAVVDKVNWCCD
ncbi:MAG: hypothetical protein IKU29_05195, partial [Parabacteroides sp.]|nr:hypothetical protein [Parabacteroides sp.]